MSVHLVAVVVVMVVVPAAAQWKTPRAPGAVRTKIDPDAPAPLTADGHPDLSGLWGLGGGPGFSRTRGASVASLTDVALAIPVTEEGARLRVARQAVGRRDPSLRSCDRHVLERGERPRRGGCQQHAERARAARRQDCDWR